MRQVLWSSPSLERVRPYTEASERKLLDVRFLGTSFKSREEIENFQPEPLSKQLHFKQSFFPNS